MYTLCTYFLSSFFWVGGRPGVDIKSKSQHTGCPVEGSADTRTKESEEAVAGKSFCSLAGCLHISPNRHTPINS